MQKEITQQLSWKHKLLLGYRGLYTLVAILFLVFISVFLIKPFKDFDLREYIKLRSNTGFSSAIINDVFYTGILESNGNEVKAFEYDYKVNGEEHRWTSYARNERLKAGSKIGIIYNKDNPAYSQIINFRTLPNGSPMGYLFFLLIPTLILLYHGAKGIYFYYIIKNGILTKARLVKKRLKNNIIDDAPDKYELTFEYYSTDEKKHRKIISKYNPENFLDEYQEYIIYHKTNPKKALLVDDLSKSVANHIKKNWTS